jgi:hypothetical protein
MELYTSKIIFDTDLMIKEINQNFDTGSVSNDKLKMENYEGMKPNFDKLHYFNQYVLPQFGELKIDNIFLFFAQPSGQLYWHRDGGHEYRRFILPISSNDECINWFRINDIEYQTKFKDGVIHWFDSQKIEHTVINGGNTTRVAFLFDMKYESEEFNSVLSKNFDNNEVF